MRRLIFAVSLLMACQAGLAAPASKALTAEIAERMQRRFEQHAVLRAEFVQEKHMAAFKKPLISRGRLVLVRGENLAWHIDAPIKLTYVMSGNKFVEIGDDGKAITRSGRDAPGVEQVGRIFRAFVSANVEALGDSFTLSQEGGVEAWRITLTPKPGPVAQYIRQIRMAGGRHVERVVIEEAGGDHTTLSFRNFLEQSALSADEQAWFGAH